MIYLDNGATTRTSERVVEAMAPYFLQTFGNASSSHSLGIQSKNALDAARETVLSAVGGGNGRVVFTSGGTEANCLALRTALRGKRGNVVVSALEHSSVGKGNEWADDWGLEWRVAPIDSSGVHTLDDFTPLIDEGTRAVMVMMANNEIGTLQPVAELGEFLKGMPRPPWFHVDCVQAFTKVPIHMLDMGITSVSLSAHKIHGSPGVGALVVSSDRPLTPLAVGGGQEDGGRPGTENVPGIYGFREAIEEATDGATETREYMQRLRTELVEGVLAAVPGASLNGDALSRLCNNAHFSFEGVRSRVVLELLEERGVLASAGSACHAGKASLSQVMKAIGVAETAGTVRCTLSRETSPEDIKKAIEALVESVAEARRLEPIVVSA